MSEDDLAALCDKIAELQARRKFFIGLINKQTNSAKALVRRALGWRVEEGAEAEAAREAVNKRAARIVTAALAGKEQKPEDEAVVAIFAKDLAVVSAVLAPCESGRAEIEKEMVRAAKKLPAHAWQKSVIGFGEKALAIIIGEAGNLARYSHPDKLKKRLGLAPYEGRAYSTWRREQGLTSEEWVKSGYAPRRRAEIHAVMDPLFKHQTVKAGVYRQVYDARRARTAELHPDWRPIHSHMDGLRVMSQKVIIDLWTEWQRASGLVTVTAADELPAATIEFAS